MTVWRVLRETFVDAADESEAIDQAGVVPFDTVFVEPLAAHEAIRWAHWRQSWVAAPFETDETVRRLDALEDAHLDPPQVERTPLDEDCVNCGRPCEPTAGGLCRRCEEHTHEIQ